jgi:hypothetical protein
MVGLAKVLHEAGWGRLDCIPGKRKALSKLLAGDDGAVEGRLAGLFQGLAAMAKTLAAPALDAHAATVTRRSYTASARTRPRGTSADAYLPSVPRYRAHFSQPGAAVLAFAIGVRALRSMVRWRSV